MTRAEEILNAARTRAERHQVAEMELYKGDKCNYSYGRIYNSEIASFEAGAKWADNTYVKGDIEKESELYAQGVVGDISEDVRHLLETAYIAGAKRIMK